MKIKTKIALIGVLALFFQTGILCAQESVAFKWAKNMGGTSSDGAFSIVTDANRNVYTTGRFLATADFDPGQGTYNLTSAGATDIFISKLDEHGNFIWAKAMGGPNDDWAYDVDTDAAGNVYLTGPFNTGTADFDPGPGVFNMTSFGSYDIFIVKLDGNGVFQWAKQMGGTGNDGGGQQIAIDASGNVYTTGIFLGTADFDPGTGVFNLASTGGGSMFISKLDASGNFVWAQKMGGGGSAYADGNAIETDAMGNTYVSGSFEGTVDFDPGAATFNMTSAGQTDIFVLKLDAAGNFLWAKKVGNNLNDESVCLTLDPSDNVLVSGGFDGTNVDFDPGPGTFNLSSFNAIGFFDIYVLKLDRDGNFIWAKSAGGSGTDYIGGITTDPAGNVYATGEFQSTVDFDPGALRVFNLTSSGGTDIATLKLDDAGNFVWAIKMGGTNFELARAVALDSRGDIYNAGYFGPSGDFDPTPNVFTLTAASASNEIFVQKVSTYTPQIISTFDSGVDGWTTTVAQAPSPAPIYSNTGGNPGGMIGAQDLPVGASVPYSYFIAPAGYLGDKCSAYGKVLKLDLQQSAARTLLQPVADVIITSGPTSLYFFSLPTYPSVAPAWTSYAVPLNEVTGQWKTSNSSTGTAATKDQIKAVLCNLTALQIRGRYGSTPPVGAIGSLDNVIMETVLLQPPPVITSFTPQSGTLATPVTINGNGFGATVAENVVYFGSTRATVTTSSATQLVVTVPGGALHGPITVLNKTTGLEAQSLRPFDPTFNEGGRIIPASLDPKIDILLDPTGGNNLVGMAVADLDGDGKNDILASENGINNISIYRNLSTIGGDITAASFAARFPLTGAGNGGGLRTLDLDGDGKLDVACGYSDGSTTFFAAYRNTSVPGTLSFEAVELFPGLVYSGPLADATDVDGDGLIDLIGQHGNGSAAPDLWISRNISVPGNIEFGVSVSYFGSATLDAGAGVSTGDLDNDGKPEMVVKHSFGNQFQIIKNNSVPGAISFGTPFPIAQGSTGSIVIADFNIDGRNDLAWKNGNSNDDIRIRLNTNSGGTLAAADFATEVILDCDLFNYGDVSISDINGDGKPDIVLTDASDMGVFENVYSGGTFNSAAFVKACVFQGAGASTYPYPIIAADLNDDQRPDIVMGVTNTAPDRISIYENKNVHTPEISLSTVSPLKGTVGSSVTITGDYFSTVPAENVVHFGAAKATVLTATKTMLTVSVPAGATYAPVSVTRNELTARYHLPFIVTFSTGVTFNAGSFGAPVDFNLVSPNLGIDVGDLNGDNKPDILVEANGSFGIPQSYAFKNTHTSGSITTSSLVADDTTNTTAQNPRLIDLNGDSKPDIASVSGIYRNSSPGTEVQFDVLTGTGAATNIAFADFNHDGKTDYTGVVGTNMQVLENRTTPGPFVTGTFPSIGNPVNFAKPAANGASAVADFDNDGFADIVATNPGTDNFTVWRNNGGYLISAAMFTSVGNIATGDNPVGVLGIHGIYAGDLDVDGKVDLVILYGAGTSSTQLSVFHNQTTGAITFARQDFAIGAAGGPSAIADLDGDGKPEIIVTCPAPTNTFIIFKNSSVAGVINVSSFTASTPYPFSNPRMVATADINLDGKLDLIFSRTTVNLLTVMENLIPSSSISYSVQPAPTTVCEGISAFFSVTAIGDNNLQYQWQVDNGGFANLSNDATYSGVNTATLTISNPTTALNGKQYRVLVHGDVTPDNPSASAVLTVNPAAPPVTTGNSGCALTSINVFASGGLNGQYRWYTAATGGTAISGEVNNTYSTPPLTTTTSYFVSINNGSCESTRAEVIATVNPGPAAPTATGASRCSAGTIVLTASGSTNGNYRWYDVATGGTALAGQVNSSFTTPSISVTTAYYVSIHNGTCESARTTVTATINTPPAKPVVNSNLAIVGSTITRGCSEILTLAAPAGFSGYLWSTGALTQQITVTTSGTITLQVTDANGCTSVSSDPLTVIVLTTCNAAPVITTDTVATEIGGDVKLALDKLIADPDNNLDLTTLRIVVQPASGAVASINANHELIIDYTGIAFSGIDKVTIEVCDALGSCTQQVITIEVVGDITVYNAISPNGDGSNEFLFLEYIDIIDETIKNRVTIFNRWGDAVFEIKDYNNTTRVFKGLNNNGNELPSGTYFYRIDFAGSRKSKTGFLALKR